MRQSIGLFIVLLVGVFTIAATDIYERLIIVEKPRKGDGYQTMHLPSNGGGLVWAGNCILKGVTLFNSSAFGEVTLYDNATEGSGKIVMKFGKFGNKDSMQVLSNACCLNGIYAVITNSSDITVEFKPLMN